MIISIETWSYLFWRTCWSRVYSMYVDRNRRHRFKSLRGQKVFSMISHGKNMLGINIITLLYVIYAYSHIHTYERSNKKQKAWSGCWSFKINREDRGSKTWRLILSISLKTSCVKFEHFHCGKLNVFKLIGRISTR